MSTETCETEPDNELLFNGTYNYLYNAEGNRVAKFEYWEGADFKGSTVPEGATNITLYTWDYRDRLTQETMESTYGTRTEVVVYTYDYANRQIGRFDYIYGYGWPKSSSETQTDYDGQNPYLEVSVPTLAVSRPTSGNYGTARFGAPTFTPRPSIRSWPRITARARSCGAWLTRRGRSATWSTTAARSSRT